MGSFNRTIVKDSQSSGLTYSWIDYNPDGSVYSTNGPVLANFKTGRKTTVSDCISANYAARRKRGEVVLNDCDRYTEDNSTSSQQLFFGTHPDWGARQISGYWVAALRDIGVIPSWFQADIEATSPIVLTKAIAKVNEADWLSLVSVAEFNKTVKLLSSPLHAFYDLTVKYRKRLREIRQLKPTLLTPRGREQFAIDVHNQLGSAWLQYRYGWTPLMHDIEDITKAYNRVMGYQRQPPLLVKRSSQSLSYSYKGSGVKSSQCHGNFEWKHSWDVKVSAGVIYKLNDALLRQQASHYTGLDLRGLVLTAWELIPYSFVVDWFVGVGDWLNASLPNPYVTLQGNWVTTKIAQVSTNVCTSTFNQINNPPPTLFTSGGGSCKSMNLSTSRRVGVPQPALPQLTTRPLGTFQQIDSLELILQRLRSLK
jgi:hypothetical protein